MFGLRRNRTCTSRNSTYYFLITTPDIFGPFNYFVVDVGDSTKPINTQRAKTQITWFPNKMLGTSMTQTNFHYDGTKKESQVISTAAYSKHL